MQQSAWRHPDPSARQITVSPAECSALGTYALADGHGSSSAKVSSPYCLYLLLPFLDIRGGLLLPFHGCGGLGRTSQRAFVIIIHCFLFGPITKSSFCPFRLQPLPGHPESLRNSQNQIP